MIVALSLAGGIAAATLADMTSHRVESTMTLAFQRDGAAAGAGVDRNDSAVLDVAARALDANFMASLGEGSAVQRNTRVAIIKSAPAVLRLAYASNDSARSQLVVGEIGKRVVEGFLSARESGAMPVPAGIVRVLSGPSTPRRSASAARILPATMLGIAFGFLCGLAGVKHRRGTTWLRP